MIPAEQLFLLALASAMAMATPGPGVVAVVSRALAFGTRHNIAFVGGMVAGDLLLLTVAMTGLAALASQGAHVLTAFTYLAAGYLLFLGLSSWRNAGRLASAGHGTRPSSLAGAFGGLAITVSNPKTIAFYLAFLPAFVDLSSLTPQSAVLVAVIVAMVLAGVMLAYTFAASSARRLVNSGRAVARLHRLTALMLVAAGLFILAR